MLDISGLHAATNLTSHGFGLLPVTAQTQSLAQPGHNWPAVPRCVWYVGTAVRLRHGPRGHRVAYLDFADYSPANPRRASRTARAAILFPMTGRSWKQHEA